MQIPTELKETKVMLAEPLKFKVKAFADGHKIEFTLNMNWAQVDTMLEEKGAVVQGIRNLIKLVESEMGSHVIGLERTP